MSIERMKRMWVLSGRAELGPLMEALAKLRAVHLVETPFPCDGLTAPSTVEGPDEAPDDAFSRRPADGRAAENRITQLTHALDIMTTFKAPKRSLGSNFVNLPMEMSERDFADAVRTLDVDDLDGRLTDLADEHMALTHRMEEIHIELEHLTLWKEIDPRAPEEYRRCLGALGRVSPRMRSLMDESEKVGETVFVNELGRTKDNRALIQVVALKEHGDDFENFLRQFDVEELPLPQGVSVCDMVRSLHVELAGYEESIETIDASIRELADGHRNDATAVLAFWEMTRDVLRSEELALDAKRLVVVTGYVRARETDEVAAGIGRDVPHAGVVFNDPALEEDVPVELHTIRLFEPAQALTSMFGLPHYRAFDPSPYIMLSFLVFFGFCFGDVVYGLALLGVSLYIVKKVRPVTAYRHFFTLLAWGGVSATIVGLFTGAWAANLADYLGENNFLMRMKNAIPHVDPMDIPVRALLVALGVGIINQFYGIILSMYRDIRVKDYTGAIFDGGLWLVTLPGLIMAVTALFSPPVPAWVSRVGVWIFLAGAVGLFLTQGRKEKGLLAKGIVGLVSIYGIIGSYGVTGFIGDTLSYSRLLALGLTTAIVGMCFNMIAGMFLGEGGDPTVWQIVLFVVVVTLGHTFNFLINVLGSFVHSGRLIFMELFGRFYESGGTRFAPLGTSERVRVVG